MSEQRKPTSILGKLPPERQEEIAEYCQQHTLAQTVAWLKVAGVAVGKSALAQWYSSWGWEQHFSECEQDTLEFMERVRQRKPGLSEQEVESFGNDYFQLRAIKHNDPAMFLKFRTARFKAESEKLKLAQKAKEISQREEALKLEREKFEFDAAEACLKHLPALRQIATNPKLSNNDRIQEIRKRLFGTLPEPQPTA